VRAARRCVRVFIKIKITSKKKNSIARRSPYAGGTRTPGITISSCCCCYYYYCYFFFPLQKYFTRRPRGHCSENTPAAVGRLLRRIRFEVFTGFRTLLCCVWCSGSGEKKISKNISISFPLLPLPV